MTVILIYVLNNSKIVTARKIYKRENNVIYLNYIQFVCCTTKAEMSSYCKVFLVFVFFKLITIGVGFHNLYKISIKKIMAWYLTG